MRTSPSCIPGRPPGKSQGPRASGPAAAISAGQVRVPAATYFDLPSSSAGRPGTFRGAHQLVSLVVLCATLGGCADYRPQPLADHPALAPSVAALDRARPGNLPPVPADRPLTLAEVGLLAVQNSPDLRATRAQLGVAQAQVIEAGLLPDPVLSGSYNFLQRTGKIRHKPANRGSVEDRDYRDFENYATRDIKHKCESPMPK